MHTKTSLYGREFALGPRAAENQAYMRLMSELGVLATEMESSHLFILASAYSSSVAPIGKPARGPGVVKAGSLLAVVGDEGVFGPAHKSRPTEEAAISVALDAALELVRSEEEPG